MTRGDEAAKRRLIELHAARFEGAAESEARSAAPGSGPFVLASAPGRVELAGNHTDHQGGRTISAAIDQRVWALATPNGTDEIRAWMDGFGEVTLRLDELDPRAGERGKSAALVRGMAAGHARAGGELRGFDLVTCSDIPVGGGLSSSAAFEVLVGAVIRALCGGALEARGGVSDQAGALDRMELARRAAQVERDYYGKPCGLQDQLASAYGGIAALDFEGATPQVTPLAFDVGAWAHTVLLVDSRCDHACYLDEFAAVPADMLAVARFFGCERLVDVPRSAFFGQLAQVRAHLGDRATLRALHFFEETRRVRAQQAALERGDFGEFLALVRQSGESSAQFLQSVSPLADGSGERQPALVVLALCAHLLDGRRADEGAAPSAGAFRIHGGGFGGSVLAIVPDGEAVRFREAMDAFLGYDACAAVSIGAGGVRVEGLAR